MEAEICQPLSKAFHKFPNNFLFLFPLETDLQVKVIEVSVLFLFF